MREARAPSSVPLCASARECIRVVESPYNTRTLSSRTQVEEEAGVRSALGTDLGTFYDMDKATVTVIFTMTVKEAREHESACLR